MKLNKIVLLLVFGISFLISNEFSKPFVQFGHLGRISVIFIGNDGKYALSGSHDKTLKLWDIKTGIELQVFKGHLHRVYSGAITPDGKYVLSGSNDKTLKLWDINTGKEIKTFKGHTGAIFTVAITPDGKYILSGSYDKTLKLWDINTGKEIRTFRGNTSSIFTVAITPDGKYALSGSRDGTLKLWSISTGKEVRNFRGHTDMVRSLAITPDGKYVLSGSYDKTLKLWDINTGKDLRTFYGHTGAILTVAITPDGKYVLSGSYDDTQKLWEINTGIEIRTFKGRSASEISITPDGKYVLSGSNDKTLKLWDINTGKEIRIFKGYSVRVEPNALTPDGRYIVTGDWNNILNIWDIKTGKQKNSFTLLDRIEKITFSSDKKFALLLNSPGGVILKNLNSGNEKQIFENYTTYTVTITKDGKYILYSDGNYDLKLQNINTGKVRQIFKGHTNSIDVISITPDGKYVLSGSHDGTLKLWDIRTGKEIRSFSPHTKGILSIAFTLDGKYAISVGYDMIAKVLNLQTGQELQSFTEHEGWITSVAITSDGKNALTSSYDKTLKLWNINTGKEIRAFKGHADSVQSVVITPNNKHAISSSHDGTTRVWDIKTGKELLSMSRFKDGNWISITPEGYFNGSAGAVKHLRITKYADHGMKPFDFSQLYDHFFRPDLVKLKLSGDEEAFQKATKGLTYQDALKNPPPKLSFKSIDTKETKNTGFEYKAVDTKKEKVNLTFNVAEHDGGGVGLIRVYQEGKLIQTIGEGKVNKQSANVDAILEQEKLDSTVKENQRQYIASLSKSISSDINLTIEDTIAKVQPKTTTNQSGTYDLEIELKSGKNEISIEAFNKTNTVTSYRENITINADIPKQKPKLYAIVAGVNEFEAPSVNNLKYSENDAKAIKDAAEQKMKTVFDDVEVIYLTGKEVTKANILKAAQDIATKAKLDDTVLFYISTHGRAYKGKLYLLPYNNLSAKNWIDFEQTFQAVQSIKALNQIFIIDACESGKANDIVSSVYDSRASVLAKSSGVHMLLATTKGTSAFEHPDPNIKNGVFTYRILQAMKDKTTDANKDSLISILELSKKLKEPTSNADYQYPVIRNVGKDVELERVAN